MSVPADTSVRIDFFRGTDPGARELRGTGETVPLVDLLIAVAAVRADAALWTRDRDVLRVSRVLPELRLHRRVR